MVVVIPVCCEVGFVPVGVSQCQKRDKSGEDRSMSIDRLKRLTYMYLSRRVIYEARLRRYGLLVLCIWINIHTI